MAITYDTFHSKDVGVTAAPVLSPSVTLNVYQMIVSNTSSVSVTVDVYKTVSAVDYYMVKGLTVPVGCSQVIIGDQQKMAMKNGEVLNVKSSVAASVDVVGSTMAM